MSVKTVIAHHPYEAEREDEISFEKEEVIKVTDFSDPDWWVGKKKDGSLGFFPSNFVTVLQDGDAPTEQPTRPEVKQPATDKEAEQEEEKSVERHDDDEQAHVEKEAEETPVEEPKTPVEEKKVDKIIGMARVMEDYAMQEQGELSLHRGGIVNVYEVIDDEWSRGELNGKIGKYPHKFVEDIDMPGRPDLGIQSTDTQHSGEDDAPKGGFKLAAFGVKQGGIGSLLAGGFPGLKKTPAKNTSPAKESPEAATVPVAAAAPAAATTPAVAPVSPPAPTTTTPVSPPAPTTTTPVSPPASTTTTTTTTNTPKAKAIVLHPYDAEGEDELSLLRGEYVDILDRHADEGWWKGRNERGLVGVFPVNFVRELEEESLAPPTPTRSRRSVQSNIETGSSPAAAPVIRPASVQAPVTTRPISVQAPAQRPSSISHTTATTANNSIVSPRISEQVKEEEEEEIIEEEGTAEEEEEEEEEEVVVKEKTITPAQSPVVAQPTAAEKPVTAAEPVTEAVTERAAVEPATEEEPAAAQSPPVPARATSFSSEDSAKPLIEHVDQSSPVVVTEDTISDEEEKETETPVLSNKEEDGENACEKKEEKTIEAEKFDDLPTGGPKLTTPARARIGRARRSPQITSQEPSQTEILEKELSLQEEEEKDVAVKVEEEEKSSTPSPPAKPVKPIFAKFPTPFAVGGDVLSKAHLKPTQTRRLWEEKANEAAPSSTQEDAEQPAVVRPSGVKNIASRFNFAGGNNSSGGNEVLETKLKNHTKNEVERVRKECEQLVNEEREKRVALEQIVQDLLERVKALEQ